MKKVKIVALISALGTMALLYFFFSSLDKPTDQRTASALVAVSDIPADTLVTAAMVKLAALPTEAVLPGALGDTAAAVGKVTKSAIFAGEQLLSEKLVATGETGSGTLAYAISPGMRALTVTVDESTGLGYMANPGDHVDVIGLFMDTDAVADDAGSGAAKRRSYATLLLENVAVLAINNILSENDRAKGDSSIYTTVTLELTPKQALELSEALFEGEIRLTLRSPVDTEKTAQPSVTLEDIMVR